ncbi:HupE/UreJ family protein [Blastococcus sp. SYSU DS0619]
MARRLARAGLVAAAAGLVLVAAPTAASAHPSETSAVLLTVGADEVDLELQIPLDRYTLATGTEIAADAGSVAAAADGIEAYVSDHLALSDENGAYAVDVGSVSLGTVNDLPTLLVDVAATPAGSSVGDVVLDYDAVSERIATHDVYVSVVSDWEAGVVPEGEAELLGVLTSDEPTIALDRADAGWWSGMTATIALGMRHIAEGTDHLMFLAMLLLPAPLVARAGRWRERRSLGATLRRAGLVVSAFTVGHSLSLAAVSLGWVSFPTTPVEVLVAASIAVAAVHAVRPLVPRGEVWIAGLFGLVHGTAFATTILDLQLDPGATLSAILGFNVGVELAQLAAVLVVLPLFVLMSRSRAFPVVRVGLAVAGFGAAVAWIVAVLSGSESVLQPVFDVVAANPWVSLLVLAGSAFVLWELFPLPGRADDEPSITESRSEEPVAVG